MKENNFSRVEILEEELQQDHILDLESEYEF